MKERGLATTRLSTDASKQNPVIALEKPVHKEVNKAQRSLDPKSQSGAENIESNVQILRDNPNIPNSQVDKIEGMAKKHDGNLGQ